VAPSLLTPPKDTDIKLISAKYSGTSAKLQYLSAILDDGTLLAELDCLTTIIYLNVYLVNSEMSDKAEVDAATLAKKWEAKRTRRVTNQRGIRRTIHPSMTKRYKTNDRQLRYRRPPVTMFTDAIYSKILSRQQHKAAQIFCTDFGFVRSSQCDGNGWSQGTR
jgi:hypothetical protein